MIEYILRDTSREYYAGILKTVQSFTGINSDILHKSIGIFGIATLALVDTGFVLEI